MNFKTRLAAFLTVALAIPLLILIMYGKAVYFLYWSLPVLGLFLVYELILKWTKK